MADYLTTDTELTSVANVIRTKGGTSAQLVYPAGFVSAIENIQEAYPSAEGVSFGTVASTITFTIEGTTYQADSGMTWGQWVASAYNTSGFTIGQANLIYTKARAICLTSKFDPVNSSNAITANYSYVLAIPIY